MSKAQQLLNLLQAARQSKQARSPVDPPEPSIVAKPVEPPDEDMADTDGESHVTVGRRGVIAATSKLLAVNRGLIPTDERDSWEFKRLMTPDKMFAERIKMDSSKMRRRLSRLAAKSGSLKGLMPFTFDSDAEGLLIGNSLSSPIEEINPVSILEQARRITLMGPGGINSSNAISEEMQGIHPSQFGFISPIEGPESERAGIDSRMAWGVKIGSDGRLYQKFFDRKNNVHRWLSPEDVSGKSIRLPD